MAGIAGDAYLASRASDAAFARKFLRARDGDVAAALALMRGYFAMRRDHPRLFQLPSRVADVLADGVFRLDLEGRSARGDLLLLFRPGAWDPARYDAWHVAAAPVPLLEVAAAAASDTCSLVEVIDCARVSWRHLACMPVALHRISVELSERALPIRYREIHVVNEGRVVSLAWRLLRPFVSEATRARLTFHGDDWRGVARAVGAEHLLPPDPSSQMPPLSLDFATLDATVSRLWSTFAP